jgi:hypothetical protein
MPSGHHMEGIEAAPAIRAAGTMVLTGLKLRRVGAFPGFVSDDRRGVAAAGHQDAERMPAGRRLESVGMGC